LSLAKCDFLVRLLRLLLFVSLKLKDYTAVSLAFLMGSTANDWLSSFYAIALVATGYGVSLLAERQHLAEETS